MLRGTGKQLTRLQNSQLVMRIHSTIFRAVPEKQALKNREGQTGSPAFADPCAPVPGGKGGSVIGFLEQGSRWFPYLERGNQSRVGLRWHHRG